MPSNIFDLKAELGTVQPKIGSSEALPYEGAKKMYLVDEVDDRERLKGIIEGTVKELGNEYYYS